ncbi:MAG: radical SAM/SPASM domain-containing protein [Microgenomates group bacterium]
MKTRRKLFSKKDFKELAIEKPVLAQIELTRNCNQFCKFCFRRLKGGKYSEVKVEKWNNLIPKLFKLGISKINLSGGEILLYKDLLSFLQFSKKANFQITLNTNGTYSLKPYLRYLDEIVFSIHGLGSLHDEIVGLAGAFNLIEKHLSEIIRSKKAILINVVVIKKNFPFLKEIYDYFSKKYPLVKSYSFQIGIRPFGSLDNNTFLSLDKKTFRDYVRFLKMIPEKKLIYRHGLGPLISKESYSDPQYLYLPACAAGKYKFLITYNGDVYPCNFFTSKDYYCGNVFRDDLKEIWKNGKGFRPFREMFLKEKVPQKCNFCEKKGFCFGGCRAWTKSYFVKGFTLERDKRCDYRDSHIGD